MIFIDLEQAYDSLSDFEMGINEESVTKGVCECN